MSKTFLWHKRAAYFAQQQREIDAIPAPSGQPSARCERINVAMHGYWMSKREKRLFTKPRNSKPKRKDHRYGLAHA